MVTEISNDSTEEEKVEWLTHLVQESKQHLQDGASFGDLVGVNKEQMEVLYALGYSLYNSMKFDDACSVFRLLCLYDGAQVRFWLGLGGCLENLKKYQEAADAYTMGSMMSGLMDPEPMYYAASCFLKMKNKEAAESALEFIDIMGRDGNVHDIDFKNRAKVLLDTIRKNK
jgi:type III secretion system low calcium response chaperone LcrH/SycD